MKILRPAARAILNRLGYELRRLPGRRAKTAERIPDAEYYRPLFSPWLGYGEFPKYFAAAGGASLVSADRCWVLYRLCRQSLAVPGDIWECGVYKGGTAAMLARIIQDGGAKKRLRLFDTFAGMPETDGSVDLHRPGDFKDTTLAAVRERVGADEIAVYHPGVIPRTFEGLEDSTIAFAHVDVDIWKSVRDCCEFIFPRLSAGGFIVFDDYGFPSCPGARKAVDEYFSGKTTVPLVLSTGQAVVFKSR